METGRWSEETKKKQRQCHRQSRKTTDHKDRIEVRKLVGRRIIDIDYWPDQQNNVTQQSSLQSKGSNLILL
ncbi:hypothetical protein Tco_0300909 [Tanacetum coccineum]